jgi:hypothetical protein
MPLANPAFPAALTPLELVLDVALDVELAADIVEGVLDDVVEEKLSVAAKREAEAGTDVWVGEIAVGRPVEVEGVGSGVVLVSTMTAVFEAPSSGGDEVISGSAEEVVGAIATP